MSHKLMSLYIGEGEYYTRIDADNVIAEKDAEIEKLDDCISDYSEKTKTLVIANLDMQRREDRQKYKRCLAMAKWCMAKYNEWAAYYPTTTTRYMKFLDKWEKRWLAIAEKFKGAK